MKNRAQLQQYLNEVRQQERLTPNESRRLLQTVYDYACDVDVRLTLIDVAWRNRYHDAGFAEWSDYYLEACEVAERCWPPQQQARIHLLASALYFNDEQDQLAAAAAQLAYRQDSGNAGIVRYYLDLAVRHLELSQETLESISDRLVMLTPTDDAQEQHQIGCYFHRLWMVNALDSFRFQAAACYQRALELGLHDGLVHEARHNLSLLQLPTE